ncbi:MAG: gamma-glutamylcyclotransferase [Gemmataceae bacterium]|nr:gamma-glutamylcyclotransferase [Gemmataceae bacterium]
MNSDVWYFAYGSNLWTDQKEERTGAIRTGEDRPRIARLADYRFAFNKPSKKWKFVANIMPCPGEEVIGIVYRCDQATMKKMDNWEPGYERQSVQVSLDDGKVVEAITYVAAAKNVTNDGHPSPEYLQKIVTGARQHGLPEKYIERVVRLAGDSPSSVQKEIVDAGAPASLPKEGRRMTRDPANIALLEEWLHGKEGEHLEFKEWKTKDDFELLCIYCCALANEGGGRFIMGVTDRRPRTVVGTVSFPQPERTRKGLCDRIPLAIDFEEIQHPDCGPGSRVLVFNVPPRPLGIPIKYDGRYWMRKEDSLVEMSEERLREIFAESGHDFSADDCPGLTLGDLDGAAVEDFRQRWVAKARKAEDVPLAERLTTLTPEQLLTDAETLMNGKLNYAALILFGTTHAVSRHLAQAEVVFEYRSSDASGAAQERREYRQGFFGYYDDLWERINKRNDKQEFQEGLFVTQISTFGERPVREAILNAVCHRNYQLGGNIFVRQYSRRLEIDSPGGFPLGITVDNILDRQNPRNRRIAEVLTKCGLVERSGQGMNLIYEELIKQSKPSPDFNRTDQYQVGLTLYGTVQDPAFVRFVEKVGKESTAFFGTHDWLIFAQAARGEKIPKGQESRLKRLLDLGLIERGSGRTYILARRYYEFVGQKGAYTRKKGLGREQNLALLAKHIEENRGTGCKLEELCQVLPALPTTQVQSLLKTLKRQGKAHPVGQRKAGLWFPGGAATSETEAENGS